MIEVESRGLNSEECRILAQISISARKGTPLESDRYVEDVAGYIERLSTNDDYRIMIASDEKEDIVGWILYYVALPLMTFINGFYPVLDEREESEEIALALIEASKRNTLERGHSRLEIELEFPTDAYRAYSEKYVDWYAKCGFQFAAEEAHMKSDLTTVELPVSGPPEGYTLRKFSEVSYELLEGSGFQIFEEGGDDLYSSMSPAERKVTLEYFFDKSRPFVEEASLILEREGDLIGFVITRLRNNEATIGPIGVVPKGRGQGLAKYMLAQALESLKAKGMTYAHLDVCITNSPAKNLYEKYGFKIVYHKQFYYWSSQVL